MVLTVSSSRPTLQNAPNTFGGLMDLYENNYISMRRLVPQLPDTGVERISHVAHGMDLYLRVDERFRYTTELTLTYFFPRGATRVAEPDLTIRIYHDARLAEVTGARLRNWPTFIASDGLPMPAFHGTELHTRWHVNRFLYKWLHYCLYQGHRFEH